MEALLNARIKLAFIFIKISVDISNNDHFVSIHISYKKKLTDTQPYLVDVTFL